MHTPPRLPRSYRVALAPTALALLAALGLGCKPAETQHAGRTAQTTDVRDADRSTFALHTHSATDIAGKPAPLAAYKGKAVLVVNTASECGYTPQYADLQALQAEYGPKGLVVLAFPSNDFGAQEPGDSARIQAFVHEKYPPSSPKAGLTLMDKVHAKGPGIDPLFAALTQTGPHATRGPVKWNFTKFLVGKDGALRARFEPKVSPGDAVVKTAIENALR